MDFPKELEVTISNTCFKVTSEGEVTRLDKEVTTRISGYGYKMIRSRGGWEYVRLIVTEAFFGPKPSDTHKANHKNYDKLDNRPSNLEWVTHAENIKHGYLREGVTGPWKGKLGKDHPLSKPVQAIKEDICLTFAGISEAARELNLIQQNVWKVVAGHRKTCGGWRFIYV